MKILVVGAGASFSTKDVENGYFKALKAAGHEPYIYLLDRRMALAYHWLKYYWKHTGKVLPEPSWHDTMYKASEEALGMALRLEVDWVLVICGMYFHPDVLVMMKRVHLPVAILFTESPFNDDEQAELSRVVDGCWTNERTSVKYLQQSNPNIQYLRHAYDIDNHKPVVPNSEIASHDVVFVGTGFQERIDLLAGVNWDGIDFGLYGRWELLPSRHRLRKYLRNDIAAGSKINAFTDALPNEDAAKLYSQAKIGLNLYRTSKEYSTRPQGTIDYAESMNPRAYELAACGVFQISSPRKEQEETLGGTYVDFKDSKELEACIRAYLADTKLRINMAREAQELIKPHTFEARTQQVLKVLEG